MLLNNRHGSVDSDTYRYGFNGKEMDDEVKGEGAQYDYGFRIYDPRLGKFLSQDPLFKAFPWFTPYQFAGNSPIMADDLDGLESRIVVFGPRGTKPLIYEEDDESINFRAIKASYYKAFANHEDWVSGSEYYHSTTENWTGPASGQLTIDATGSVAKIKYTKDSGWKTFKRGISKAAEATNMWLFDPNPMIEGSEKFNDTFWTYTTSVLSGPLEAVALGRIAIFARSSKATQGSVKLIQTMRDRLLNQVTNSKLKSTIDQLWRKGAKYKSGSTGDAIRGEKLGMTFANSSNHLQKAKEALNTMTKLLKGNHGKLKEADNKAIFEVIEDLTRDTGLKWKGVNWDYLKNAPIKK